MKSLVLVWLVGCGGGADTPATPPSVPGPAVPLPPDAAPTAKPDSKPDSAQTVLRELLVVLQNIYAAGSEINEATTSPALEAATKRLEQHKTELTALTARAKAFESNADVTQTLAQIRILVEETEAQVATKRKKR